MVLGSNPAAETSPRNFGNSVYPALPVSFGGDTKSRRSLLCGVYARGIKDSTSLHWKCVTCRGLHHFLEKDNSKNNPVYNTQVSVPHSIGRKGKEKEDWVSGVSGSGTHGKGLTGSLWGPSTIPVEREYWNYVGQHSNNKMCKNRYCNFTITIQSYQCISLYTHLKFLSNRGSL